MPFHWHFLSRPPSDFFSNDDGYENEWYDPTYQPTFTPTSEPAPKQESDLIQLLNLHHKMQRLLIKILS